MKIQALKRSVPTLKPYQHQYQKKGNEIKSRACGWTLTASIDFHASGDSSVYLNFVVAWRGEIICRREITLHESSTSIGQRIIAFVITLDIIAKLPSSAQTAGCFRSVGRNNQKQEVRPVKVSGGGGLFNMSTLAVVLKRLFLLPQQEDVTLSSSNEKMKTKLNYHNNISRAIFGDQFRRLRASPGRPDVERIRMQVGGRDRVRGGR